MAPEPILPTRSKHATHPETIKGQGVGGSAATGGIADEERLPVWPPLVAVASCAAPTAISYALRPRHVPEALIVPTVVALGAAALTASTLLLGALLYLVMMAGMAHLRVIERRRHRNPEASRYMQEGARVPEGLAQWEGYGTNVVPFILKERDSKVRR